MIGICLGKGYTYKHKAYAAYWYKLVYIPYVKLKYEKLVLDQLCPVEGVKEFFLFSHDFYNKSVSTPNDLNYVIIVIKQKILLLVATSQWKIRKILSKFKIK